MCDCGQPCNNSTGGPLPPTTPLIEAPEAAMRIGVRGGEEGGDGFCLVWVRSRYPTRFERRSTTQIVHGDGATGTLQRRVRAPSISPRETGRTSVQNNEFGAEFECQPHTMSPYITTLRSPICSWGSMRTAVFFCSQFCSSACATQEKRAVNPSPLHVQILASTTEGRYNVVQIRSIAETGPSSDAWPLLVGSQEPYGGVLSVTRRFGVPHSQVGDDSIRVTEEFPGGYR